MQWNLLSVDRNVHATAAPFNDLLPLLKLALLNDSLRLLLPQRPLLSDPSNSLLGPDSDPFGCLIHCQLLLELGIQPRNASDD